MSLNLSGGKAKAVFYPINSAHTTVTAVAALTLDETVKTDVSGDNFSFDQGKADELLFTFLNTYVYNRSPDEPEADKMILETGVTRTSSASSSVQQFLCLVYGEENTDGVLVAHGIGTISKDSGGWSQEFQKFVKPTFQLDLIQAKAEVVLAIALYDAAIVTVAAPGAMPINNSKYVTFETPA